MQFYQQCLGGELILQTVAGSPLENECPPTMKDQILHASLNNEGFILMGSDMNGPDGYIQGTHIALTLNCKSEKEINISFKQLSDGAKIIHNLRIAFWGAIFAVFTDRYGIKWMLNFDKQTHPENVF